LQVIKTFHCVGCGRPIPWDGRGTFAFTCPCGATIFADDEHVPSLPASLIHSVALGRRPAHIDYYLGISNYISAEKQKIYEELRALGAIWSWECKECKERTVKLRKAQLESGMPKFELHPELKALL